MKNNTLIMKSFVVVFPYLNQRQSGQLFYSTLWCGKFTQKEDREHQQCINNSINKRLLRAQAEVLNGTRSEEEVHGAFVEGLCRILSGINAATSRNVIDSDMQHLLLCNGGIYFQFSHSFGILLFRIMKATLERWVTDVQVRSNI